MKETQHRTETETATLLSLRPGNRVEVRNAFGQRVSGIVETVHPDHGLVWIHNHLLERKLLDIHEHVIVWVCTQGQTGRQDP